MADGAPPDFRFWAFISYSSKDAAMAKKLHRALEHYSIPKDLRGRPGRDGPVPEKIFPVFRDRDELPLASDLGSTITDALRASRYLIVLCSPNSAKSRWVDEEIRTFKAMGREDRILALILDGEPNAADVPGQEERECFPPCLKVRVGTDGVPTKEPVEPIGGDLRKGKDGWTAAFLKCVAGITGLGFNAFARRELRRKRIRQAVAGLALLAIAAAGIWWWDYTRLKTSRFESMVMRHGVPEGLHPVADEDFARRYATFVFEETRRKVRMVKAVNRIGTPMTFTLTDAAQTANSEFGFPQTTSSMAVNYREDGSVASHDIFDVTSRILLRHVYSADLRVVEMKNPGRDTAQTLEAGFASMGRRGSGGNIDGAPQSQKTEIARWRATYDDSGFIMEKAYGNAWGEPTADTDGKAMVRYTRNSEGRVITETALDRDGSVVVETGTLVEGTKFEYNEKGRLSGIRFVDSGLNPVPGPLGYAFEEIVCDAQGNVVLRRFADSNGKTIIRDDGIAIFKAAYDGNGFIQQKSFYDTEGKPVTVPAFGFHMERYENDDKGRPISYSYIGADDKPALDRRGAHRQEDKLDSSGRQKSMVLLGVDGKAVLHGVELWHRMDLDYDERGNLTEVAYFAADGKPINSNTGCHRNRVAYDDANRIVGQRYFGVDNKPALCSDGYHEVRYAYDPRGNIKQFSYHGTDREPALNKTGVSIYRQGFDERGNLIELANYGKREENVLDRDTWIHKTTYRYNARGQEIERRYFDAAGRAMNDPREGYHLTRYEYSPKGAVAAEEWFDTDDQPVLRRSDRVHRYQNEHDGKGRVIALSYYGLDGSRIHCSGGFHLFRRSHDERGNMTSEAYFGTAEEPVVSLEHGFHRHERDYDGRNRHVLSRYFDVNLKSAPHKGFLNHQIKLEYGDGKLETARTYLDGDGKPVLHQNDGWARMESKYNERGGLVEVTYFDAELKPMDPDQTGYHRWVNTLDHMGNAVQTEYFAASGKPVLMNKGYHRYQAVLDEKGRTLETRYFGVRGEPVLSSAFTAHMVRFTYDESGNVLTQATFDTRGRPSPGANGFHRLEQKFDAAGNEIDERYFDADGKATTIHNANGHHANIRKYDGFGQVVEESYFDTDDRPMLVEDGYHRIGSEYDDFGNAIATRYFDADGEPVEDEELGVHAWLRKYDDLNQLIETWYEDVEDNLTLSKEGLARVTNSYDALGNLVEVRYFAADDTPKMFRGGHRYVLSYDPKTNERSGMVVYDTEGNLVRE